METLTAKTVRVKLEQMQGLEPNALKSKKEEISELIDEVIAEMEKEDVKEEADADQGDEDESEEEEKPAKKAKTAPKGKEEAGGEKKPKMTCRTRSGEECPKGVKAMQEKLKITTPQVDAPAPTHPPPAPPPLAPRQGVPTRAPWRPRTASRHVLAAADLSSSPLRRSQSTSAATR